MSKITVPEKLYYEYMDSPIGELLLAGSSEALYFLGFPEGKGRVEPKSEWKASEGASSDVFADARGQLAEYFSGSRREFDLKLAPHGTEFQLEVLDALCKIPYGKTCSYLDLANEIGRPKAVRAVGAANGRNPLPIIIPCHRVVGADGSLTGFGGGMAAKYWLLSHENALPETASSRQSLLF